jgi:hypothetical protein
MKIDNGKYHESLSTHHNLVKINKNITDTLHEFLGASRTGIAEYFIGKKNVSNKCRDKLGIYFTSKHVIRISCGLRDN